MNIFYTHSDPNKCAFEHCTVHTRKMIIEYAQMLSTTHRVLDGDAYADLHGLYKKTHMNHPSTKWVRESSANYAWLYQTFVALCSVYLAANAKPHKTSRLIQPLLKIPDNMPRGEFTEPPMAMPEEFQSNVVTESYRTYVKSKYADWTSRERKIEVKWHFDEPEWL